MPAAHPHALRHSYAVHLLESGVEVNVIRGWLGHADLSTTNRYAEINTKAKQAALRATQTPGFFGGTPDHPDLAHGRDPAELARLALTVMQPTPANEARQTLAAQRFPPAS